MALDCRFTPNDNYVNARIPLLAPGKYSFSMWAQRRTTVTNESLFLCGFYNASDTDFINCYVYNQAQTLGGSNTVGQGDENFVANAFLAQTGETHWLTWMFDTSTETAWNAPRAFYDGVERTLTTGSQNGGPTNFPVTIGPWLTIGNRRDFSQAWDGLLGEFSLVRGWMTPTEIARIHRGQPAIQVLPQARLIYYNALRGVGDADLISGQVPDYVDQNSEIYKSAAFHPITKGANREARAALHIRQEFALGIIDVTPNIFADAATGIAVTGSGFGT